MSAIETADLTKEFGDVTAVDSLDLSVESGEIFGFLGPNGAGKSTTINLLLGFVTPTAGRATVSGHDIVEESETVRNCLGVLPEGFTAYDRLTAREHVVYSAELKDVNPRTDEVLSRVGLSESAWDRPAGDFSKGMQQRLALACALTGDPEVLILDEPSSGLDPQGMAEIRDLLTAEAESGTTVFYSSHILSQVESVCDRVGIMNEGTLVATDTIEGLRETAGVGNSFTLTVDSLPSNHGIESIDGVNSVTVAGNTVEVTCHEPSARARVISEVEQTDTTITEIDTDDASLQELFTAYLDESSGKTTTHQEQTA